MEPCIYLLMCFVPILLFISMLIAQKMKFSIKISSVNVTRKLRIWSDLLQKSLMESLIFCAVAVKNSAVNAVKS